MFVKTYMTRYPITVKPEVSVVDALEIMKEQKVRKLPVVKDKKLIGLVTEQDLLKVSPSPATSLSIYEQMYLLNKLPVKEAMVKNVITVASETTIEEAALLMHDRKLSCMPVIDNGELVGIITQTDISEAIISIFGLRKPGKRLLLEADDRIGLLWEITGYVKEEGINIISAALRQKSDNKIEIMLRLGTTDLKNLISRLEEKGFIVKNIH